MKGTGTTGCVAAPADEESGCHAGPACVRARTAGRPDAPRPGGRRRAPTPRAGAAAGSRWSARRCRRGRRGARAAPGRPESPDPSAPRRPPPRRAPQSADAVRWGGAPTPRRAGGRWSGSHGHTSGGGGAPALTPPGRERWRGGGAEGGTGPHSLRTVRRMVGSTRPERFTCAPRAATGRPQWAAAATRSPTAMLVTPRVIKPRHDGFSGTDEWEWVLPPQRCLKAKVCGRASHQKTRRG